MAGIYKRLLAIASWSTLLLALSSLGIAYSEGVEALYKLEKNDCIFALIICTIGGVAMDLFYRRARK